MQILKAGVLYFALVFGAGFVLGTARTLWIVPRVGTRRAELMETPIMLVVTIVAARWIVLHFAVPSTPSSRLGMGCIALVLLLLAEFGCFGFGACRSETTSLPETPCRERSTM